VTALPPSSQQWLDWRLISRGYAAAQCLERCMSGALTLKHHTDSVFSERSRLRDDGAMTVVLPQSTAQVHQRLSLFQGTFST
jgi:hypothetical protein